MKIPHLLLARILCKDLGPLDLRSAITAPPDPSVHVMSTLKNVADGRCYGFFASNEQKEPWLLTLITLLVNNASYLLSAAERADEYEESMACLDGQGIKRVEIETGPHSVTAKVLTLTERIQILKGLAATD